VSSPEGEDTVPATIEPLFQLPVGAVPAIRVDHRRANPNHHLWRNGRLWWIAYTVLHDGWRQERVRHSLHTSDIVEARARRDDILRTLQRAHLRLDGPLVNQGCADAGENART
jgi:hypothetical protein